MSGNLTHTPAQVVHQLLIDLALGVSSVSSQWATYVTHQPDTPDDSLCVYDTEGRIGGRSHIDGEIQEHHGLQIRVRSTTHSVGHLRAEAIIQALDLLYWQTVLVEEFAYLVQSVSRVGDLIQLGPEIPTSRRRLFTINALVSLRQLIVEEEELVSEDLLLFF